MEKSGKNDPKQQGTKDDKQSTTPKTDKKEKPERKLAPEPKDEDGSAGLSGTSGI